MVTREEEIEMKTYTYSFKRRKLIQGKQYSINHVCYVYRYLYGQP